MTTGKTIALTKWAFVSTVMSMLFNMLSRFVSFSFKEQASFNFIASVTIYSDFGVQENKICHCFHCFPTYLLWNDGTGCHDLHFLNAEFKPAFSLSSFTIKRIFSSSSLSGTRMVSSAYLSLLWFLPAILIPACASSSLAFHMIYSSYKLNKQGDYIQPWLNSFPNLETVLFHVQF